LLPYELSLFWFVPGAPRHPFHTYRLTLGDLCIGQPQLGDEIGGTDKIPRWSNPGISKVRGRQLPGVGTNGIALWQFHPRQQAPDNDNGVIGLPRQP
jgi:hypothetical protein